MNLEAPFQGRRPTREEHQREELEDLQQQFDDLERQVASGELGRSGQKVLLTFAYDKLLHMEEKNELTAEQAESFHARAEQINGQLYEDAA